jgi:uncharacterized protein
MTLRPFHLAFPVHDLAAARQFYGEFMGCGEGRSSDCWIDFDLYGHQIVTHLVEGYGTGPLPHPTTHDDTLLGGRVGERAGAASGASQTNKVDGHNVPVPHFGIVLTMPDWEALAEKLKAAGVTFGIEPQIRFKGEVGEQATMFFTDPSGNALEFKAFADDSQLFATEKP